MTYRHPREQEPKPRRSASASALLVSTATVLFAVFTLVGMNGNVNQLSARVAVLQADVDRLSEIEVRIQELNEALVQVDETVTKVTREVKELGNARAEIIGSICDVLELPPNRCGL